MPSIERLDHRRLFTSYSAPIVITQGGDYSGNWQSLNPSVPAIVVMTTEPVTIENSNIRGRGDLIVDGLNGTDITVRSTNGYGLNPGVSGLSPGRFLDVHDPANILLDHNNMTGTSGILIDGFVGSAALGQSIRILGNHALNIDGRKSNGQTSEGPSGFLDFNTRTNRSTGEVKNGFNTVQFVQIAHAMGVADVDIAWNSVVNQPGLSRVEDNISIYESEGTPTSPITIHDNFIDGAYTIDPTQKDSHDSQWNYNWDYSGGGIMLGDGDASYVTAFNNQVISTTNYGIAITAGHDIDFHNNTIISSGLLADGQSIVDQNVGAAIWNAPGNSGDPFYDDTGENNTIGWMTAWGPNDATNDATNDAWTPNATSWTNNTYLPGPVSLSTEAAQLTVWKFKLAHR